MMMMKPDENKYNFVMKVITIYEVLHVSFFYFVLTHFSEMELFYEAIFV